MEDNTLTQWLSKNDLKVIFLDLDGTIINDRDEVSSTCRQEIRRLQEQGIIISIASGRPYFPAIKALLKDLNIKAPSQFFAGAMILDTEDDRLLQSTPLEADDIQRIIDVGRLNNWHVEALTQDSYLTENKNKLTAIHAEYLKIEPELCSLEALKTRGSIVKMEFIFDLSDQDVDPLALNTAFPNLALTSGYGAAHPDILFVSVTNPNACRERAFPQLLSALSEKSGQIIKPENAMAMGDAEGDIPFIKLAGFGVAMGNANTVVKEAADFVTDSVDNDGAALVMQRVGQLYL